MNSKVQTRFMAKALTCGICLDQVAFQGTLDSCKHVYCFDCISYWAQTENSCPVCKIRFTKITRLPHRVDYAGDSQPRHVSVATKDQKSTYMHTEMLSLLELAETMISDELRRLIENLR